MSALAEIGNVPTAWIGTLGVELDKQTLGPRHASGCDISHWEAEWFWLPGSSVGLEHGREK